MDEEFAMLRWKQTALLHYSVNPEYEIVRKMLVVYLHSPIFPYTNSPVLLCYRLHNLFIGFQHLSPRGEPG